MAFVSEKFQESKQYHKQSRIYAKKYTCDVSNPLCSEKLRKNHRKCSPRNALHHGLQPRTMPGIPTPRFILLILIQTGSKGNPKKKLPYVYFSDQKLMKRNLVGAPLPRLLPLLGLPFNCGIIHAPYTTFYPKTSGNTKWRFTKCETGKYVSC